jgi:uncharacterized membrane protein
MTSEPDQPVEATRRDAKTPPAGPPLLLEPAGANSRQIPPPRGPSAVPAGHGWDWIARGFGYFRSNPGAWILAVLIFFGISVLLSFVPFVGGLGVSLLATVFTGGLMRGVREQEEGRFFRVKHLFAGFSNNAGQLVLVAILYLVGTLIIAVLIGAWMFAVAGPMLTIMTPNAAHPAGPEAMLAVVGPTILIPLLVGSLLVIPLMMAYFFAPALVVLDGLSATAAMRLSFAGCLKNVLPFLLYGLIGLVLFVLAAIPFGLGLLIMVPAFVASVYAAYQDIYV